MEASLTQAEYELLDEAIAKLHANWMPHQTQAWVGAALFRYAIREIFIQCGRKWGKSEIVIYILWRLARTTPGGAFYYICPQFTQGKELIWANKRIQRFGPQEWIKDINNTECRVTLDNDAFIKMDGSDNHEKYRGINPHGIVYDEFKDFHPDFHVAMEPNLATHNAPLVIIGTPPEREMQYTDLATEFKNHPDKAWFNFKTEQNPYINKEWLQKKRETLIARGEEDVWFREYEAKFVRGGKASIFPMVDKSLVYPHQKLMSRLRRDMRKLEWYAIADPGSTTCFAVLFIALNPYTKDVFFLDEIYETDQRKTATRVVGNEIVRIIEDLYRKGDWRLGRDEAAAWFGNEMMDAFGDEYYFAPIPKSANTKENGLSMFKDMVRLGSVFISDRCEKFLWELMNYVKDKNGKIPKEDDHLIDGMRYFLTMSGYELSEKKEVPPESLPPDHRGATIEQDRDRGVFDDDSGDMREPLDLEYY